MDFLFHGQLMLLYRDCFLATNTMALLENKTTRQPRLPKLKTDTFKLQNLKNDERQQTYKRLLWKT